MASFGLEEVGSFPLEGSVVVCSVGLPNGCIATGHGSPESVVCVWSARGDLTATLRGHRRAVFALACTPSGDIVSGAMDKLVKVWHEGACVHTLEGHTMWVVAVAASPVDGAIVSGSADYTAKVWSPSTGECVATLEGHEDGVAAVCVLSSGDVVTGSTDRTTRVWERGSWACTAVYAQAHRVEAVAALPDGGFAVSAGSDSFGLLSVWRGGRETWTETLDSCVDVFALRHGALVACSMDTLYMLDGEQLTAMKRAPSLMPAALPGGVLAISSQSAGRAPSFTLYRVVRTSRLATIHTMVTAWALFRGVLPGDSEGGPGDDAARMLCFRRMCRPRGEDAPAHEWEVVEPFAQAVVMFL